MCIGAFNVEFKYAESLNIQINRTLRSISGLRSCFNLTINRLKRDLLLLIAFIRFNDEYFATKKLFCCSKDFFSLQWLTPKNTL